MTMPRDDQLPDASKIPYGVWEGHEDLAQRLSQPHGFQSILADKRPLGLDYLPATPADHGTYVYLALVYPLIDLKVSLWEYYHSQSDIDLHPKTYITDEAPFELQGTSFHEGKEAHRLHWQPDARAVERFLDFIRTIICKQDVRKRVWALTVDTVEIPYPKAGSKEVVPVRLVLPYSPRGAFMPVVKTYEIGKPRRRRIVWADRDNVSDVAQWRRRQNQLRFEKQKHGNAYKGLPPMDDEVHPYYKAEELVATAQTLWSA